MKNERTREGTGPGPDRPDWSTVPARVVWLLETRFGGNRSAFAAAIRFSHTAVNMVARGERKPGPKLLTAIANSLRVRPGWLLRGEGQPFADIEGLVGRGVPTSGLMLPGAPQDHQHMLDGGGLDLGDALFAPSQYWLRLHSDQPIVSPPYRGFRTGDHLLMETSPERFPAKDALTSRVCVVRIGPAETALRLAGVTYYEGSVEDGPERLEADTFALAGDPKKMAREEVYRHLPNGEIQHRTRRLEMRTYRGRERPFPIDEGSREPAPPRIRDRDIVAVWLGVLYRPGGGY